MNEPLDQRLKTYYQSSQRYCDDLRTHDEAFLQPYLLLIARYVNAGARLLDLGCGTALSTRLLVEQGYEAIGVDLSPLFLQVEKSQRPQTPLLSASALQLPFADHTFDAIAAFEFIEHIPDVPALLNEVLRVLKPSGWLVLHSPNLLSPYLPACDAIRLLLGGEGRPVFAENLAQACSWLKSNLVLSFSKKFSWQAQFLYREPDLSEARIGGDADSVYWANPIDLAIYLRQRGCRIYQRAHAMSMKNKCLAALTPSFAPYMGLVAQHLNKIS